MARRIDASLLGLTLVATALSVAQSERCALAEEVTLSAEGEAQAKEGLRLFRQGRYDEAAQLFAQLSVEYPDVLVFERNVGACFHHLRKPEPALSNLRHYLGRKKNISPDDEAVVRRWIDEMEELRREQAATVAPSAPTLGAPAAPLPPAAPAVDVHATNASGAPQKTSALNLKSEPATRTPYPPPHFYTTWWFWTALGAVATGSVTAYWLATRGGSQKACSGGTLPCEVVP